uniref:Uncharacterized protein n=1 Tax=Globisporangium ultimum (strain ATCC 200006 / CBS 805.95 / DAOM BR144) TaxID=431595 RepID=K3X6R3_GLOUD
MQPRAIEGTVPYYERHFVIVDAHGRPEDWPKKLEFSDHIMSSYAQSLNAIESKRGGSAKSSPLNFTAVVPYKRTTCSDQVQDAPAATEPKDLAESHDVLVFPENIRVHGVSKSTSMDFRCACAGPKMLQWLEEIATDAKVPLHLWAASHYGGHRYAGNCVAYPSGDWFGMLNSKEDVHQMVDALVANQPLRLQEHWRGRIRLSKEQQIEALKEFGKEAA